MEYTVTRTCARCKKEDHYPVGKIEAAFRLYDWASIYKSPCTKCGSVKCASTSYPEIDIDKDLLDLWGNDPNWHFYDQDEEILLAEKDNLYLFLEAIDNHIYSEKKLDILLSALCILYYDNVIEPEEYTDEENIERRKIADLVLPELVKRKHSIKQIPDWRLGEYVREIIYPDLEL